MNTTWLRRAAIAALSAAAVACTEPAEPPPDPEAAAEIGNVEPLPHTLPAPGDAPRYVGLWAASADGCTEPAWRFEAQRVSTRGEISCEFQDVSLTDAGYAIQASCTAEAPPAPYNIRLSFAESARTMMITGAPWAASNLVYCGPLPTP